MADTTMLDMMRAMRVLCGQAPTKHMVFTAKGERVHLEGGVPVADRHVTLGHPAPGARGRTHVTTPLTGGETCLVADMDLITRPAFLCGPLADVPDDPRFSQHPRRPNCG